MCAKFQGYLTPTTGFLATDTTFLTNIPGNHFSHNICAVFYHSELKFLNLDPNWAKNRPLLLKTLDVSNCVDSGIVQWIRSTLMVSRTQRYEEFHSGMVRYGIFAKSWYTGIFRYGISLIFLYRDFGKLFGMFRY